MDSNNEITLQAMRNGYRIRRNTMLSESDWTQLADVSDETKLKWQPYRQALRDIPQQDGFPTEINWPQEPQ